MERWDILPLKSVFSWTKSKEMISSDLYMNLQRSLSPQEKYFLGNKKLFKKNDSSYNKQIFDLFQSYVVVDKDKLPENFLKLFELDLNDTDIENQVKNIFQKARLLDKKSARIVFVDDKIVIFRNEERLVHKQSKWLTQWEKKRSEIVTTFNTFSNIYDAVRSQYYIIQNSEDKKDECKIYQQELLKLAQEAKYFWVQNVKNWEWKRKIDQIIEETKNARNFKVLAANLQNLENLTFKNPSIDANLLEWAKNKFRKRFWDLQNILGVVNKQLNDMTNILVEYENALDMFLSSMSFANQDLVLSNYRKDYRKINDKYWDISPFCVFNEWIEKYNKDEKNYLNFVNQMKTLLEAYKSEHTDKLMEIEKPNISLPAPEIENFGEVKDNLRLLEELIVKK